MRARVMVPITLAVVAGVGCVMLLVPMLNANRNSYKFDENSIPVVVASDHLQAAQAVTENMVRVVGMPPALVPPGAFSSIEAVIGRVLRSNLSPQMPVVEDILAPEGRRAGLEGLIEDGYRAKTIKVDEWSAVAHFVKPGSRVDLLAAVRDENNTYTDTSHDNNTNRSKLRKRFVPRTILKNVKVLATGKTLSEQEGRKNDTENVVPERSVTLMLKPREVEILVMHEAAQGRLSLALRSGSEEGDSDEAYGEFLEQQLRADTEGSMEPPHRFNTWVGQGQNFDVVTYQKVGGVWYRENEEQGSPATERSSPRPLPTLRTSPPDGSGGERAKLISAEQTTPGPNAEPGL